MKIKEVFKQSIKIDVPKKTLFVFVVLFCLSIIYPSDMSFYLENKTDNVPYHVDFIEHKARFTNTILQALLPIIMRDPVGLAQAINVGIATTIATHSMKFAFNNVHIGSTRLGQRPYSQNSSSNMPSGHSSMASCAAYFVARRYGYRWLFVLLPILILTMYARFMLDMHTLSATIAGASIGIICAIFLTSKKNTQDV